MKYLIKNNIEFNPADGSLLYLDSQDVIRLPLPASRLLEEFMTSDGQDLMRDYLLENVWDKHGLHASGNNLNQYVSILRRNFSLMDCPELIITLPKVGFKVNPAISIVPVADDQPEAGGQRSGDPRWSRKITPGLLFLLAVSGLAWGIWMLLPANNSFTELHEPVSNCEIVYLKDVAEEGRSRIAEEVTAALKKNNLQCRQDEVIFYNKENARLSRNSTRTLLALCSRGNKNDIVSCENLYLYKWVR